MKSRISKWSQKDRMELCGALHNDIEEAINGNGLVNIIAFARASGWRRKRLLKLRDIINECQNEYAEYSHDGIFDIKVKEELESYGLTMDDIMPEHIEFKEMIKKDKRRKKSESPTFVESMRIRQKQEEIQNALKEVLDEKQIHKMP